MDIQKLRTLSRIILMTLFILHMFTWFIVGIHVVGNIGIDAFYYGIARGIITGGFIFWIIVFLSALLFGRAFCGWFCWFGGYQDLVIWGFNKTNYPIPRRSPLYIAIIAFVSLCLNFYFTVIDVWNNKGFPDSINIQLDVPVLWNSNITMTFILLTLIFYGPLLMFVLGKKAWCRYLCPIGMILKFFNKISFGKFRLVSDACTGCGACNRSCEMEIDVSGELKRYNEVRNLNCIRCFKCSDTCPQNAIAFTMKPIAEVEISKEAADRIEKRSLKYRKRSMFDISIFSIWIMITLFFTVMGLKSNPLLADLKVIMNVGLVLIIFTFVWTVQKIWIRKKTLRTS